MTEQEENAHCALVHEWASLNDVNKGIAEDNESKGNKQLGKLFDYLFNTHQCLRVRQRNRFKATWSTYYEDRFICKRRAGTSGSINYD